MLHLQAAAIYAGVNILILLILAYLVVDKRRTHKILLGDGGNEAAQRAIRAHANAAEYIPAGLVGIVILALMDPQTPAWLLHASGLALTAGRIIHAIGLHLGVLNLGRMVGMALTWIAYALLGVGLIAAGLGYRL